MKQEPYDVNRVQLFEHLSIYLQQCFFAERVYRYSAISFKNISFFESYFSNFIERIEFIIDEAEDIVFSDIEVDSRHADSHDVIANYSLTNDFLEMGKTPQSASDLLTILKARHAYLMQERPDKNPGEFKTKSNKAGNTYFVDSQDVVGTLQEGFKIYKKGGGVRGAILITGANGFVGRHLCEKLLEAGFSVRALVRTGFENAPKHAQLEIIAVGDLEKFKNWDNVLNNIDTVIHLAAHVHQMHASLDPDSDKKFFEINTDLTTNLVHAMVAQIHPPKQIIYLSTIKVNGESTLPGKSFTAADKPNPQGAYAESKYQAENTVINILANKNININNTQYTIIRPPLIYGEGAGGNIQRVKDFLKKYGFLPLPIGCINNQRSLIDVNYLCEIMVNMILCSDSIVEYKNKIILVADKQDYTIQQIFQKWGKLVGRNRLWIVPVPVCVLKWVARCFGKQEAVNRITENLQVEST